MLIRLILSALLVVSSQTLLADIFGLAHFIAPQSYSLGLEPVLIMHNGLVSGSGFGINVKGTYGISNLSNFILTVGTGAGPQRFHWNGTFSLDFFPDYQNQPGIGMALGLGTTNNGQETGWEAVSTFYVHKTIALHPDESGKQFILEPFLAIPLGLWLAKGRYFVESSVTIGSFYHFSEKWSSVAELGIGFQHTNTYLSGGMIYYY
jgi:hypothetical protein